MKDFRSKMQSIFPAIPKNSESAVEWEEALKSKWDERGGWIPTIEYRKDTRQQRDSLISPQEDMQITVWTHGMDGVQCVQRLSCCVCACVWCWGRTKFSRSSEDCLKMMTQTTSLCGGDPQWMTATVETEFGTWRKIFVTHSSGQQYLHVSD